MREIKFRGVRFDNGQLAYGDLNTKSPFGISIRSHESGNEFTVDPETVGQFSGLKDKNGEALYSLNWFPFASQKRL